MTCKEESQKLNPEIDPGQATKYGINTAINDVSLSYDETDDY